MQRRGKATCKAEATSKGRRSKGRDDVRQGNELWMPVKGGGRKHIGVDVMQ
jgi:hypothetical protein